MKRIVSRNHPEVDEGWLCDKGRFGFAHLRADDRVVDPLRRPGRAATRSSRGTPPSTRQSRCCARRGSNVVTALSGSETTEQAYALGKLLREGLGAHCAVMPEDVSPALDAFRLPLSAIRGAELIVVLGDDPVVERAPVVDLWLRAARRAGAEIVTTPIGTADRGVGAVREGELATRLRNAERAI